jgi:serine/threonine protein kinase
MSPVRELQGSKLLIYKLRWKLGSVIRSTKKLSFNDSSFIKRGSRVRLTEALTMDFIAQNTTIPVPRVLDVFAINGVVHIVQEFIDAPVLEDVWHTLSPDQQRSSMAQLKDCLDQLHALQPQRPDRVQAIDGSGCIDDRLASGEWGPFDDHAAFHRFLGHDVFRESPERYPLVQEALSRTCGRQYRTVFAHGDLGPHNILWKDGRIFVIDWERSGWFPEYWDYTRAYEARGYAMPDWWKLFRETVDRYDDEVEVDRRILNYVERL